MIAQHNRQSQQDSDLELRVSNLLWQRASLRRIQVAVLQGRVLLSGTVNSFYERQLCISGARRVAGVYQLVDEIKVA